QRTHGRICAIVHSHALESTHCSSARRLHAVESRGELDVLERRERRIEHALVRDQSDDRSRVRAGGEFDPGYSRGPTRGSEQTGKYAKQRGLSGPIRTEQCEAFPIPDGERESADGDATPERARQ